MTHQLRVLTVIAALLSVVLPSAVLAHDGHEHKIMGTVSKIEKKVLTVKTQEGTLATISINDETRLVRDQQRVALADVAVGDRVVVNVGSGKEPLVAKEVRLGPAPGGSPK